MLRDRWPRYRKMHSNVAGSHLLTRYELEDRASIWFGDRAQDLVGGARRLFDQAHRPTGCPSGSAITAKDPKSPGSGAGGIRTAPPSSTARSR